MKRRLGLCLPVALCLLAAPAAGESQESEWSAETPAVIAEIESLFRIQDAAANGHRDAGERQKQLLAQIRSRREADILAIAANTANAGRLASHVFSGGQPELGEHFAEKRELDARSKHLLRGAAMFMRGKSKVAAALLDPIDPVSLTPSVGGRLALAKAMLSSADPAERERYLATAISLMPGTLVEESALRRSALFFAAAGDKENFWRRTSRYLRRFRTSLYAPEFMTAAIDRAVEFEKSGRNLDRLQFDFLLAAVPVPSRRPTLINLMRQSVTQNLPNLARYGASRLRRLSVDGSAELALADLYGSLQDITTAHYDESVVRLKSIDASRLSKEDRELLDAALTIARQIRARNENSEPLAYPGNETGTEPGLTALRDRVHKALRRADEIISDART